MATDEPLLDVAAALADGTAVNTVSMEPYKIAWTGGTTANCHTGLLQTTGAVPFLRTAFGQPRGLSLNE